jgi:Zn-dependent M28 family amino/carboxypeptidase
MLVADSKRRRPGAVDPAVAALLRGVSPDRLRGYVEALAFPRHYLADRPANVRARDLLIGLLRGWGYAPALQGSYDNVVAAPAGDGPYLLLGAHYDSVPGTPGADDNASAAAAVLECARLLRGGGAGRVMFVFFNREEDGLLGSREFVAGLPGRGRAVGEAHVFEMVGFRTRAPGSQRLPPGLPGVVAPDTGDFLGLIANRRSNAAAEDLLGLAATYLPGFPVLALKTYFGVERLLGHLHRSDHAPFWAAGLPAVMWTDTSEFRNPHYHRPTDTPDTLDYDFLADVTRLALARAA